MQFAILEADDHVGLGVQQIAQALALETHRVVLRGTREGRERGRGEKMIRSERAGGGALRRTIFHVFKTWNDAPLIINQGAFDSLKRR